MSVAENIYINEIYCLWKATNLNALALFLFLMDKEEPFDCQNIF